MPLLETLPALADGSTRARGSQLLVDGVGRTLEDARDEHLRFAPRELQLGRERGSFETSDLLRRCDSSREEIDSVRLENAQHARQIGRSRDGFLAELGLGLSDDTSRLVLSHWDRGDVGRSDPRPTGRGDPQSDESASQTHDLRYHRAAMRPWIVAAMLLGVSTTASADEPLEFRWAIEAHASFLSNQADRSLVNVTFGGALRFGYRGDEWGGYFQMEQNAWLATELYRGVVPGVWNLAMGVERLWASGLIRTAMAAGISILAYDTELHERGNTGIFFDLRPAALRWSPATTSSATSSGGWMTSSRIEFGCREPSGSRGDTRDGRGEPVLRDAESGT